MKLLNYIFDSLVDRRSLLRKSSGFLIILLFQGFLPDKWKFSRFLKSAFASIDTPLIDIKRLSNGRPIGKRFDGEELKYKVGFLWFKEAGTASFSFKKKGEKNYIGKVEAETSGFIGWLLKYRKDTYQAHMRESNDGKRLKTYFFEKKVTIGKKIRRHDITVDYNNRLITWGKWGTARSKTKGAKEIPFGVTYNDPLVTVYNLRYGSYGNLKKGKELSLQTFFKIEKGPAYISLRVATDQEKKKRLRGKRDSENVAYLVDLKVSKELIDSSTGKIEIHMNRKHLPVRGIVKDIILFGDVTGTLI